MVRATQLIRPAAEGKRLHAGAAAEPDGRVVGDPPSVGADFDATPELIRQIEVDQAVVLGEANRDLALGAIELGLCLKHIEGCVQRGRARRIPGPLVVLLAQPGLKALAAKRPGFPVAVDEEIGKAGAVACVKEPGGRCDIEEDSRCCSRRSTVVRSAYANLIGPRLPRTVRGGGN